MANTLQEIDALEILVIVDNELDPITPSMNPAVQLEGGLKEIGLGSLFPAPGRGDCSKELRMEGICCGAHGLSLMITAIKGDERRTVLFDTGPEEEVWEHNVKRLRPDLSPVELIHLSHWHRDHSGGMGRAVRMINEARGEGNVTVDLHPNRPDYRGIMAMKPVSLEADPTFEEVEQAGGIVSTNDRPHTVAGDMFMISGEIPRVTDYEVGIKRGIRFSKATGEWTDDKLIMDERLMMCNLKGKGIVVFTGCSHAGAVNASKHALELGGGAPLYCVFGGYHLADAEAETIAATVADFKKLGPKVMMPGHCTGWRAKFEIEKSLPGTLVPSFVGSKFTL